MYYVIESFINLEADDPVENTESKLFFDYTEAIQEFISHASPEMNIQVEQKAFKSIVGVISDNTHELYRRVWIIFEHPEDTEIDELAAAIVSDYVQSELSKIKIQVKEVA